MALLPVFLQVQPELEPYTLFVQCRLLLLQKIHIQQQSCLKWSFLLHLKDFESLPVFQLPLHQKQSLLSTTDTLDSDLCLFSFFLP